MTRSSKRIPGSAGLLALLLIALVPLPAWSESARTALADGFDFPVGKPDAIGYYKARGYRANGHLGEDWNGRGGGNTDLGAPVYSVANGLVVYSSNFGRGWGNVIIVRHAYRERSGRIRYVDSLYGHLHERNARLHQRVRRGQKIGTIGNNNGMYWAHLHFEMRKNLDIGMNRSDFARDDRNYYSPTTFIREHRTLSQEFTLVRVPTLQQNRSSILAPPADARSATSAEIDRFLSQHQIHVRPESVSSSLSIRKFQTVQKRDTPEARAERGKIRAFWQKFRERNGSA